MIARYQNYFLIIPVFFSVLAVVAILMFGLKPGIDLTGGSLLQVSYPNGRLSADDVHASKAY